MLLEDLQKLRSTLASTELERRGVWEPRTLSDSKGYWLHGPGAGYDADQSFLVCLEQNSYLEYAQVIYRANDIYVQECSSQILICVITVYIYCRSYKLYAARPAEFSSVNP